MKPVRYTRAALTDLESIAHYTGRTWGSRKAKAYVSDIRQHIDRLAAGLVATQRLPVERANIFKSRINRHLVIHELNEDAIIIVRVLHEVMDVPSYL